MNDAAVLLLDESVLRVAMIFLLAQKDVEFVNLRFQLLHFALKFAHSFDIRLRAGVEQFLENSKKTIILKLLLQI